MKNIQVPAIMHRAIQTFSRPMSKLSSLSMDLTNIVGSGFGIRAVLRGIYESPRLADELPTQLPYKEQRVLQMVYAGRALLSDETFGKKTEDKALASLLAYARNNLVRESARDLDEIDFRSFDPIEFRREYVIKRKPVIVRHAFDPRWDFQRILNTYGDVNVTFKDEAEKVQFVKPLSYLRTNTTNEHLYVGLCEEIFRQSTEVLDYLDCKFWRDTLYSKTDRLQYMYGAQLFIGNRPRTGPCYHCAADANFFFMLEGTKVWTLVHPKYTCLLYPDTFASTLGYFGSQLRKEGRSERWPLYDYCPRATGEIRSGDVLFNPPFWWHTIDNMADTTAAISTRWFYTKDSSTFGRSYFKFLQSFSGLVFRAQAEYMNHFILHGDTPCFPTGEDNRSFFEESAHSKYKKKPSRSI